MTLAQRSGAYRFVGNGTWVDGSIFTNPTDQTLLVDTGALPAGDYLVAVNGAASADEVFDVQHRNAANSANVNVQRRRPKAGDIDWVFSNKFTVAANERIRVLQSGGLTGEVQLSIFYVEVEPGP